MSGPWIVTQDFFGTLRYTRLRLEQNGSKLTGELNGDKLEGTVRDSTIHFVARNENQDTFEVRGTLVHGILTGTMVATDSANREHPYTFSLTAKAAPLLKHGAPQRHDFKPTAFYRQFSAQQASLDDRTRRYHPHHYSGCRRHRCSVMRPDSS